MITDAELYQARLLVVDDEPENTLLLQSLLRGEGYASVVTTNDARAVAGLYREFRPDLVLLDLAMPHLDGFQVMAQLRAIETEPVLPVLVITGQSDRDTKVRALESGARDFVSKPFDIVEIMCRIRNLLEVRLLTQRVRSQNVVLEEQVGHRTRELRETQLEVVRRLAHAAERRDTATGQHIVRMSQFCQRLAEAAGLDARTSELILNASPLHDVGKIAIPDSILLKPGKLNTQEWEVMKRHTTIGAELLYGGTSELIRAGQQIALTHHEWWDGHGYPLGMRQEAIPLYGRIAAICDVYDAVRSDRCYHQAISPADAAEEIRRGKGTHFDPALVEVFDLVQPDFEEIRSRLAKQNGGAAA